MEREERELIEALSDENEPDCRVLRQLVRHPATLHNDYTCREALSLAVNNSFVTSVRILLEAGVSPNIKSDYDDEETALHIACFQQQPEIVQDLLKYNANVNAENRVKRTPLHEASWNGNIEIMRLLLQNGAMINAEAEEGITPLHLAIDFSRGEASVVAAVQVLLSAGADVDASDEEGRTPLHFVVKDGSPQVVRLLLRYKADVNSGDLYGNTPLHHSVKNKDSSEIIRELVKGGARLDSWNCECHTPLYDAVIHVDANATQEMLRWGATFEIDECLKSLGRSASVQRLRADITAIAQQLLRYVFIQKPDSYEDIRSGSLESIHSGSSESIHSDSSESIHSDSLESIHPGSLESIHSDSLESIPPDSLESIHQQLMEENVSNILRNISSPECDLNKLQQTCFSEAEALSKLKCDCGKSSIWGSITNREECDCETHQAILKFLFSGRKSNFTDAFFYKLDENSLLEVTLTLISYFAFKESGKRLILPYPCLKEIQRNVSFEDAVEFLQSYQSKMDASELEKYMVFMKEESSVKSSSESGPPSAKRLRVS